ncbi:TPA: hypothetical protein L4559_003507 [Pseudomonas aeruginosa]|nr:hypothetical protein [Pseudomonas aeruginosa]
MHDRLTKTRFINALVREHEYIQANRKRLGKETFAGYLKIELDAHHRRSTCRLIIRGNILGTHWMIHDTGQPITPDGVRKAYHLAVDIVFKAVQRISAKTNEPASIELPPISYYEPWYEAKAEPEKKSALTEVPSEI